jgi:hypothetical protein
LDFGQYSSLIQYLQLHLEKFVLRDRCLNLQAFQGNYAGPAEHMGFEAAGHEEEESETAATSSCRGN